MLEIQEIVDTREKTPRFEPLIGLGGFARDGESVSLSLNFERYFIDAEWDGGSVSEDVTIPSYTLNYENGERIKLWKMDYVTLEYLCGKKPVDVIDELNLKNSIVEVRTDFILKDTYYKNLKINKIAEYVERL